MRTYLSEPQIQELVNFQLMYIHNLELPIKRGNFIDFRNSLINLCPAGRCCNDEERKIFIEYDKKHEVRQKFCDALTAKFGADSAFKFRFVIGGEVSFDCQPIGWDKS